MTTFLEFLSGVLEGEQWVHFLLNYIHRNVLLITNILKVHLGQC